MSRRRSCSGLILGILTRNSRPRFSAKEDSIPPQVPPPIGGGADLRLNALHLTGQPIAALSTSRLFAYVSHFGAQPIGVEWINDSSVNIVFANAEAARLAIEYICPAVPMSSTPLTPLPQLKDLEEASQLTEGNEWPMPLLESCLMPRRAHRFPSKLYNGVERDYLSKAAEERRTELNPAPSEFPDDAPDIYRELEQQDKSLAKNQGDPVLKDVRRLLATMWVRFALASADIKAKNAKKQSEWYKERGDDAGRQVVTKLLDVSEKSEARELLPGSSMEANRRDNANNRHLELPGAPWLRIGASQPYDASSAADRASPSASSSTSRPLPPHMTMRSGGRTEMQRRSASPTRAGGGGGEGARSRGRGARGRAVMDGMDDLDADMDRYAAQRDTTPLAGTAEDADMMEATADDGTTQPQKQTKIRGRGRHKAPGSSGGMAGWRDDMPVSSASSSSSGTTARARRGDSYRERRGGKGGGGGGGGSQLGSDGSSWGDRTYETAAGSSFNNGSGSSGVADGSTLAQRLGVAPGQPTLQERLAAGDKGRDSPSLADRFGGDAGGGGGGKKGGMISSWD